VSTPRAIQRQGVATARTSAAGGRLDDEDPLAAEVLRALAANTAVERFDLTERLVHWSTAALMLLLILTGGILYIPNLAISVGHRALVEEIHVYSGIALLVPLVFGVLGPWRAKLLADLRRFDRWSPADWDYFRKRKSGMSLGKFNGGQKAEAAVVVGGMLVMLATGVLMRYGPLSWNRWQEGATLVHDLGFFALGLVVAVHIAKAINRPEQLKSMWRGTISRGWAKTNAPAWLAEIEAGEE
jgi:formate dehydrogenase subunit gamma